MLYSQDLVNHLKQQGFDIQTASISESIMGEQKNVNENPKNNPLVSLPFTKGITNVKLFKCPVCNKKFANDQLVDNHINKEHPNNDLETTSHLSEGNTNKEEDKIEICTQYEIFDNDFMPTNVEENNSEESFYLVLKIDNCYDGLNSKSTHTGERRVRRPETKPRKVYDRSSKSNKRIKSESDNDFLKGPFNCVQCEGVFNVCCEYSKHFDEEHSKRKSTSHKCQICEKKFDLSVSYQHTTANNDSDETTIQAVTCSECGLAFQSVAQLNQHRQVDHVKAKAIKCDYEQCNKMFTTYAALNQHTKLHSGIRPFVCLADSCLKSFSQKSGLEQHVRTHTLQRPFSCVICTSTFRQASHLSQHMRTHSNIHPYACTHCPKKFKQSSHLSYHMQVTHPNM